MAALEPGRTSWTLPLDAVRLGPADDATEVTAAQVRDVVQSLIAAGHWRDGDPDTLVVFDAGYDLTRLAWLLRDLPVEVLGRLRSDRVMYFPAPPRLPGTNGRPLRHGAAFKLADPGTWPTPAAAAAGAAGHALGGGTGLVASFTNTPRSRTMTWLSAPATSRTRGPLFLASRRPVPAPSRRTPHLPAHRPAAPWL